ncbi:hypothetical protein H0H93_012722 [Arthromyces matolae]|nr:hypothetical protein H0H93_012722 [Arthromyces matolae]
MVRDIPRNVPYQLQQTMIIIRPRILISASIISLALLLVSASPLPSSDVALARGKDDLVTTDSPTFSQLQPRDVTEDIANLIVQGVRIYTNRSPATDEGKHKLLLLLQTLQSKISGLSWPNTQSPSLIDSIRQIIKTAKFTILEWPLTDQADIIKAIEACENAADTKGISTAVTPAEYKTPEEVKVLLGEIEREMSPPTGSGSVRTSNLAKVVFHTGHLSLKQQRTIRSELEKVYKIVSEWKGAVVGNQEYYVARLKDWKGLNSLMVE